jgi:hypothetical protein
MVPPVTAPTLPLARRPPTLRVEKLLPLISWIRASSFPFSPHSADIPRLLYYFDSGDPQKNLFLDPSQVAKGLALDGQQNNAASASFHSSSFISSD